MTLMLVMAVMLSGLVFTACGVNEIKELIVVGNAYSEYVVGEKYDYSNITVKVTFNDDTNYEVKGSDERVTISGFSTETAGSRNMTITFDDGEVKASCDLGYTVYKNEQTIKSVNDIEKIANQTATADNGVLFFPADMTFDMTNYPISRSIELTARQGVKVTLKNVKINSSTTENRTVTFNNIIFTNALSATNDNKSNALTFSGDGIVDATINKCQIVASGMCFHGIHMNNKGKFILKNSEFKTPTDSDIFQALTYMTSKNSRDITYETVISGNTIICNFAYGLQGILNATIENNYVDATLTATGIGDYAFSATSQKSFVARKNPSFIHSELPATKPGVKLFLTVKNNKVLNAQNFLRIYNLDLYNYDTELEYVFEGNTLSNVAVLVNTSSKSYASLSKILADLHTDINTGYNREYKAVITKDTEISVSQNGMPVSKIDRTGAYIYYDFTGEDDNYATMSINGNDYVYVGTATRLTDLHNAECWIIKDMYSEEYYVTTLIDYSPNGDVPYFMSDKGVTKSINEAKTFDQATIMALLGMGE
jgi:hypothetical protein